MPKEKEIVDKKESGICVVHDDTFGWGGPETEEKEIVKEKIKKIINDEPVNWPFNRFR